MNHDRFSSPTRTTARVREALPALHASAVRNLLRAVVVNDQRGPAPVPHGVARAPEAPEGVWADEILSRERALRAAILIDAVRCLIGVPGGRDRRARRAAARWVLSRDTKFPFSFYNVCESLGFDPSRVRRLLLMPCLEADEGSHFGLDGKRAGMVRRPRREPGRYVLLSGGLKR
jgi:hypothetical protein